MRQSRYLILLDYASPMKKKCMKRKRETELSVQTNPKKKTRTSMKRKRPLSWDQVCEISRFFFEAYLV